MKPQQAHLRQQQAQSRRSRLQEIEAAAQTAALRNPQLLYMHKRAQMGSRHGMQMRHLRDPNRGLITSAEWNELVEKGDESGKTFRYLFWILVLGALVILTFFKYDEEFHLEVPQIENGRGFGEVLTPGAAASGSKTAAPGQSIPASEVEEYYRTLGVEGRLQEVRASPRGDGNGEGDEDEASEDGAPTSAEVVADEDPDVQRRLENYRVRQEIKRAFQQHQEKQGQLVHCGRTCEAKNKQVELAYNRLASQVDRELFGVLLDATDTKSARSATPGELKKKYEEKRELILAESKDEEYRDMALEELKDAYDIIQDPEARKYYLLYGTKPPEYMRHVNARHGGWGQEMALGTFKYRIIISWLDFLHNSVGLWGETAVLLCVVGFVFSRLPVALKQSQSLLDDLEWQDQQHEEEQLAQQQASAGETEGADKAN